MKTLRSISLILLASSAMCFLVAYERYVSAVKTAEKLAEAMGLKLESVGIPQVTIVCGLIGVTLLVASIGCYVEYRKGREA